MNKENFFKFNFNRGFWYLGKKARAFLLPFSFSALIFFIATCQTDNLTGPKGDITPPTITNHTFSVDENVSNNTLVGTVVATDNEGITSYAITAGNTNTAFAIDNTGQLTTAASLDYLTTSNYSLMVEVADAAGNTASNIITINVNDIDSVSPVITNHTFSIDEDVAINTLVGTVIATDNGEIASYTITSGNTGNTFAIDNTGRLTTATNLDYETTSNYSLTVEVADAADNTASNTITINVNDIDDTPPVITNHTFSVADNVAINTLVGTVLATDNEGITSYTITSGNTGNAFAIDNTGRLTTATNLDYETTSNYSLMVEVADAASNTARATVIVNLIFKFTKYSSNTTTNDLAAAPMRVLTAPTSIDSLSSKMLAWLDVSVSPLLLQNSNGGLTNWLNKSDYRVSTNVRLVIDSVTTNTNRRTLGNEQVTVTNIIYSNTATLTLALSSAIFATPKSDVSANNSLSFSNGGTTNGYVILDYEGDDRVGFALDTTSMGDDDIITAFYFVTERTGGNSRYYPVLGYDNMEEGSRFITRAYSSANYIVTAGSTGVGDIVLGDSTFERNSEFAIPTNVHLLSRRGLNISKTNLNGFLGSFPVNNGKIGGQRIRELIVFTNAISDLEHSNVVRYLYDKWNLPPEPPTTNLFSSYSANGANAKSNVLDGDTNTYFRGQDSSQVISLPVTECFLNIDF